MKSQRASRPAKPPVRLNITDPALLQPEVDEARAAIQRRAYELYEERGSVHGHNWEDWFQAESELLRPVSVAVAENRDQYSVRANVLGFEENELRIGILPHRVLIVGRKFITDTQSEGGKNVYIDWFPDSVVRVIGLDKEIIPAKARVELHSGLLKFELPKAAPDLPAGEPRTSC